MKQLIWPGARLLQAELHQHRSEVTKEKKKTSQNQSGFDVRTESWDLGTVMNQFRKVAAGSGLSHVVGFLSTFKYFSVWLTD